MTEKTYREKVLGLGGMIDGGNSVSFPGKFRIKNKGEALAVMDILITDPEERGYSIDLYEPLAALKAAIISGDITAEGGK